MGGGFGVSGLGFRGVTEKGLDFRHVKIVKLTFKVMGSLSKLKTDDPNVKGTFSGV